MHGDQVDDRIGVLSTLEAWLAQATGPVHHDLHHYLATAHQPDPAARLLADQIDDLLARLTTTPTDWLTLLNPLLDPDQLPTLLRPQTADQLLEQISAATAPLRPPDRPTPPSARPAIPDAQARAPGPTPTTLPSRLVTQAAAALTAERDERGRTPILALDEAHLLTYEQLETIRMITNHGMDQDSPLACLLIGQPSLRRTMKLAVLAALEQRTALRYTMPGMTPTETTGCIRHHLSIAGRSDTLFSDDATTLIHTTARGYPRAINHLFLQALVATYAANNTLVDETATRTAVTEVLD